MDSKRFGIPAVVAVAVLALLASGSTAAETSLAGRWQGAIELPGQRLEIAIAISGSDGAWTGTIDIPAQGARNLPLSGFEASSKNVQFSIAGIPGDPTFRGIRSSEGASDVIAGQLTQGGQAFAFRIDRSVAPTPTPTVTGSAFWKGLPAMPARKEGTKPAHPLDEYAGDYVHPAQGVIAISQGGASGLKGTVRGAPVRLQHWHYETFRVVFEDPALANEKMFVLFRTNVNGDVDALEIPLEAESKEIVFEKKRLQP